ncbi:hypothetical protein H4R33_006583 [Dimargaris cristalligena]|nr:hypothetical protein H4R33_006583 [Dimargaris cristalligena]
MSLTSSSTSSLTKGAAATTAQDTSRLDPGSGASSRLPSEATRPAASLSLDELNSAMANVENQIQALILDNYEPLLFHITQIKTNGARLVELESDVQRMKEIQERLRQRIRIPYEHLSLYTNQIENLHAASDAVTYLSKLGQLTRRLDLLLDDSALGAENSSKSTSTGPALSPSASQAPASGPDSDRTVQNYISAAVTLRDIDRLQVGHSELTDLTWLNAELQRVADQRQRLCNQADTRLSDGLSHRGAHYGDLALGCQIYYYLDQLGPRMVQVLDQEHKEFVTAVTTWVNLSATATTIPVSSSTSSLASSPATTSTPSSLPPVGAGKFWDLLDVLFDHLTQAATRVYTLEKVLTRKRDTRTQRSFLDVLIQTTGLRPVTHFWNQVATYLTELFHQRLKYTTGGNFVITTLTNHYPKLLLRLHAFYGGLAPLQRKQVPAAVGVGGGQMGPGIGLGLGLGLTGQTPSINGSTASSERYEQVPENMLLLRSFAPFESGYLAKIDARIGGKAVGILGVTTPNTLGGSPAQPSSQSGVGGTALPSKSQMGTMVRTLLNEIEVVKFDTMLSLHVVRLINKQFDEFLQQIEKWASTQPRAYHLGYSESTDTMPALQVRNLDLANTAAGLIEHIRKWSVTMPPALLAKLGESDRRGQRLVDRILDPLFKQISQSIQDTVAKMHAEGAYRSSLKANNNSLSNSGGGGSSSRYSHFIIELAHRIKYVRRLVEKLDSAVDRVARVRSLGQRLLQLFMRHVSLVPQLQDADKMQLTDDLTQLEFSLNQLLGRVKLELKDLGPTYQMLREFRSLVFMDYNQVAPVVGDGKGGNNGRRQRSAQLAAIPNDLVVQYLFSQLPKKLTRPHEHLHLSVHEYARWLDTHGADDNRVLQRETAQAAMASMSGLGGSAQTEAKSLLDSIGAILGMDADSSAE